MNPDFFTGTAVEQAASRVIAADRAAATRPLPCSAI
jgi:hypothetical protein